MSQYEHSKVFASLKGHKERIQGNLTSAQYLLTLDNYLNAALSTLVLYTRVVDTFVANVIGWQDNNRRRKISMLDRDEFRLRATVWLLAQSREDKADTLKKLKLERGALLELCDAFLKTTTSYVSACNNRRLNNGTRCSRTDNLMHKAFIEEALGASKSLMAVRHDVDRWYSAALDYKNKILEKYIRLALKSAQYDYVRYFNHSVPLDDLSQTYILAVARAIDKCDASQGVLTTQVQFWLYTARTHMSRLRSSDADDIEDPQNAIMDPKSVEDQIEERQGLEMYRRAASILDKRGAASAFLGLLVDC